MKSIKSPFTNVKIKPLIDKKRLPHRESFSVFSKVCRVLYLCEKLIFMATISINLIVPQGWHELDDKQLRYVYSLIAKEFSADEIKTLALPKWATPKVRGSRGSINDKLSTINAMSKAIHIITTRTMLKSGDPVDISVWKANGSILELRN